MLDAQELALKLHNVLSQTSDKDGAPTKVSEYTKAYAKGVVASLKSAVVTNAPGTIVGVCAPGSPLSAGAGIAGLVVALPVQMLAETVKTFPPGSTVMLTQENIAIITYISTALAVFSPGSITGTCTNTAESPGPLLNGAGSGGKLTIINGIGAYAAVSAAIGPLGPSALLHYNTLINYILDKAEVTYSTGSVVGICPSGGGPLGAGAGVGGTIT